MVTMKQLDSLDEGCRSVLAHSPIAGFGFQGFQDNDFRTATFVGGTPGFMHVESPKHISFALPDGLHRPAEGSGVSFVFFLPGIGETLRLNGSVARSESKLRVGVEEAYVHCARCILRSGLWHGKQSPMPTKGAALRDSDGDGDGDGDGMVLHRPQIADFLAASPFLVISTWDSEGGSDTSPRGDQAGFVRILDGRTLAIPDRKGNQRADTFHNVLADNRIALAAVIPGRTDVLHLSGTASITDDPALLSTMALKGAAPQAALVIDVESAEVIDNEALSRSHVWQRSSHIDRSTVPDLMVLAAKHAATTKATPTPGAPNPSLLKPLAAFPRLTRLLINAGYRMQLKKEGYQPEERRDSAGVSGGRRYGLRRLLERLGRRPSQRPENARSSPSMRLREVRVVEVVRETANAVTVLVEDESGTPFRFKPGQYFTFVAEIDGRTLRRAYSASSAPGTTRLAITAKRVQDGTFSTYLNRDLRPGDRLHILGPSGSFYVESPPPTARELVLLAAGSGVTPMMSVIRTLLAADSHSRLTLIYGNRTEDDVIFADELSALCDRHPDRLTVRHVLTQPSATWTGGTGRLTPETLRRELDELEPSGSAHFFVCGPEPMMDGVRDTLTGLGVTPDRIHEERFTRPVGELTRIETGRHSMAVDSDGQHMGTVDVESGGTLLDAGLAAGLPMPYSCTVGNCGECMVKLVKGEVQMAQPNSLTSEQQAQGYVLTCVGYPRSSVSVDIGESETS
ncbi:ring-1,2-phenylacetyl-CoA epoxidase subunit PaaE/hypothetical protein [Sinosporangium album]|uniref:Ferredoxin-NADP reductase n=2 Tax=Sinosporangium album TaxID=504805 RepID=A0A1G8KP21_9ACTN|nr:ring-1,2-phenylacetyl-CoA epoxidase subunit PaaE/hypothetical protein [Sinosporangium album]